MTGGACGKMRGRFYILATATLIVATTALCACAPAEAPATSEYTPVTIGELIGNTTKYDGQKVVVSGEYTILSQGIPGCIPVDGNRSPEYREKYSFYPSTWGISDSEGAIGTVVIRPEGVLVGGPLDDYKEGDTIELRGTLKSATVQDYCFPYIHFRSMYIEVNTGDIDIDLKPSPSQ